MLIETFTVGGHNRHYEGAYSEEALRWRKVGAIDKVNNLASVLSNRAVGTVLEVGCGTGAVLAEIARAGIGHRHVGVDVADPQHHVDKDARELDLRVYDGVELPFPNGSFDLVVASHVLEHVPNPRGLLAELHRVAARLVYVEVPCEITVRMRRAAIQRALETGHINAYTPEHFLILLQTVGMEVIEFQIFDHSREVHLFGRPAWKANLEMLARRVLLRASPIAASRMFCYHTGALLRGAGSA